MLSDPTKYDSAFPFPLFRPLPSGVQLAFKFIKKRYWFNSFATVNQRGDRRWNNTVSWKVDNSNEVYIFYSLWMVLWFLLHPSRVRSVNALWDRACGFFVLIRKGYSIRELISYYYYDEITLFCIFLYCRCTAKSGRETSWFNFSWRTRSQENEFLFVFGP